MQNILLWILAWNQTLFSRIHPAPQLRWGELPGSACFSLTSACGWLSAAGPVPPMGAKTQPSCACSQARDMAISRVNGRHSNSTHFLCN